MTALYLHEDVKELLAGKTLVVIGDSVERSVYKDLVCLLQENRYLKDAELRKKGEESFLHDELVYGGCKGEMKNSIHYRESRYFKTDDEACCRYYFVTISYGDYVEEILQELSQEPTDVIVMNSCLWDVHRHGKRGVDKYEENLEKLVASLRRLLPDCLFLWLTTPPVDIKSKGGFLQRPGQDLVKINEVRFCNQIARDVFNSANETDRRFRIVDLGYVFQYFEHHRASDGVHWNEKAHRRISNMILEEVAKAFDKKVPRILPISSSDSYEQPMLPSTPHNDQWENHGPPHQQFPEMHNNNYDFDRGFNDNNGWEFENNGQFPRPFRPRPPPPHGAYPFGPPQMPPPMPFGPMGHMRPSFMGDQHYREPFHDLDDLGDARKQVEDRLKQRKYSTEPENNGEPEKNYRFGVTSSQLGSSLKRKNSEKEPGTPAKVTIIETNGEMKKLVELSDGTTLHSHMTEKEKQEHIQQQEKARLDKIKKEKEAKEKIEREAKQKAEREERERIKKQQAEEKAKLKEEEKAKAAEEAKFASLKKLDVSGLPLISTVPDKEVVSDEQKPEGKAENRVSKFASKLLSFIKNPLSKNKDSSTTPIENSDQTFSELVNPLNKKIKEEVPDEKPPSDNSANENINYKNKPLSTAPVRKVDTLALLSMQSPFAKVKSTSPKPNQLIKTETVDQVKKIGVLAKKGDDESESDLLNDADGDTMGDSDVDDSILDDDYVPKQTKNNVSSNTKENSKNNQNILKTIKTENSNDEKPMKMLIKPNNLAENNNKKVIKPTKSVKCETNNKIINIDSNKRKVEALNENKFDLQSNKRVKFDNSMNNDLNMTASSQDSLDDDTTIKKKKKKTKHPNETKEERTARRKIKKEKKEKARQDKLKLKTDSESQKITVVADTNQWNKPMYRNHNENRQRSATWAPIYQQSYTPRNLQTKDQQQQSYNQQYTITSQQQQQQAAAAALLVNPYQNLTTQQNLLQKQRQEQMLQQQRQQQLLQQQIVQQQIVQQQALLLQQQRQQQQQHQQQQQQKSQEISTQQSLEQQQQQQASYGSNAQPQLYIDEYGQTYTLEEETFMIGPSGEIQNISSAPAAGISIQQQSQLGVQQQYNIQSSLLYSQQK